MKKLTYIFYLAMVVLLSSCFDDITSNEEQAEIDDKKIQEYLEQNNITATKTSTGLYHEVLEEGTGQNPLVSEVVEVAYKASVMGDGRIYQEEDVYVFKPNVGSFLLGLSEAPTHMKKGGKSRFYLPSDLAYGIFSTIINSVAIPENAIIIMEVELNDIRNDRDQELYEDDLLKQYLADNNLVSASDSLGVYHVITQEGEGGFPTDGNGVEIAYKGMFLNGELFDESPQLLYPIGDENFIKGFDIGIRMMKQGEIGLLLIPSQHAYGAQGNPNGIPPYTPLIFEIEVTQF